MADVVLRMSRRRALDLLWCTCGHRPNNHFDHLKERPCAHCKCQKYTEMPVHGVSFERPLPGSEGR